MKRLIIAICLTCAVATQARASEACYVDHVEAAAGGLNVYMLTHLNDGRSLTVVTPKKDDARFDYYFFDYDRPPERTYVDGQWVATPPPSFTYLAIGQFAAVSIQTHAGCRLTVEAEGTTAKLHLRQTLSFPDMTPSVTEFDVRPSADSSEIKQ
jgi:hypothetical protein